MSLRPHDCSLWLIGKAATMGIWDDARRPHIMLAPYVQAGHFLTTKQVVCRV